MADLPPTYISTTRIVNIGFMALAIMIPTTEGRGNIAGGDATGAAPEVLPMEQKTVGNRIMVILSTRLASTSLLWLMRLPERANPWRHHFLADVAKLPMESCGDLELEVKLLISHSTTLEVVTKLVSARDRESTRNCYQRIRRPSKL